MSVEDILKWISENKQWVFSGVGIFIIAAVSSMVRWILSGRRQRLSRTTPTPEATVGRSTTGHSKGELTDEIPLTTQTINLSFDDHGGAHALTMNDGTRVRAEVHLAWRVINPYLFCFSSKDHPFDVLVPLLLSRLRGFMEGMTLEDACDGRREVEVRAIQNLGIEFEKRGIRIESITIGAMENVNRA